MAGLRFNIGGKKLTDEAKNGMASFFAAGKDSWNSNEGYRISASVNEGTHFAERVYNETTGLALDLPDVQKVADIFFTIVSILQGGVFRGWFSSPQPDPGCKMIVTKEQ